MTIIKGYKATDADMKCRDLQYVLGEWQEVEGDLIECENGLHFCDELASTLTFYNSPSHRYFECEADDVLTAKAVAGVVEKRVGRKLRLTKEIFIGGNQNTGNQNTGDWNTGNQNTGDRNTGDWNTGDRNTGNRSTGDRNTGDRNTGNRNTGNRNTGNWSTGNQNTGNWNTGNRNTGNQNTGNQNTGNWNTGNQNTGNQNTGNWNACNYSSGFFNAKEPKIISFDEYCEYSRDEYLDKFSHLLYELSDLLLSEDPIAVDRFIEIPNITQVKLDNLHRLHIEGQRKG